LTRNSGSLRYRGADDANDDMLFPLLAISDRADDLPGNRTPDRVSLMEHEGLAFTDAFVLADIGSAL
jgi:hypothetical protein